VALKLIAPDLAEDERFRARFLKEPRLAASLDHPNVVPIYEAGERDGQLYLAMRYVEGSDLRSVLRREGKLAPERAIRVLAQVAAALDRAHRRGLVHRDVKPANVLLDVDEHAYLSDFGISTQDGGAAVEAGGTVGTLDYLSPEQIRGEAVDGRGDCYALACILYECLAGEPPFRRKSEAETLWAHLRDEPSPLRGHPALDPVLRKGLAKEKGERYASCAALVEAVRSALGLATPAVRDSARLLRRGRAIMAAGALILAGAVAAGVVAVATGGDPDSGPAGNTLLALDAATGRVVEQVPVGATPTDVAIGGGAAWSLSADEKTVSRVALGSGTVRTFSAGPHPIEIAFGGDSLWAAEARGRATRFASIDAATSPAALTRFDPVSGAERATTPLPVPSKLMFNVPPGNVLATERRAVWAVGRPGWVYRLDLRSGRVLTRRSLQAWGIATGNGQVWIHDRDKRAVRLDPRTGRPLQRVSLPAEWLRSIAVGDGAVWLADGPTGRVLRVDPSGGKVRRIDVGPGVDSIAVGAGAVWAANSERGTVVRIDPSSNRVVTRIEVGDMPRALAVAGNKLWIAVAGTEAADPAAGLRADAGVTALTAPPCGRVLTGGRGDADLLIASDLPLRGQLAATLPMAEAVEFVLRRHDFRAGRFRLGYQSCDDATDQYGIYDAGKCRDNARGYARNRAVVGVVGPLNSGCAAEMLPVLNRAPAGPVALVSPVNTDPGLVRSRAIGSVEKTEYRLRDLYPTGQRGYARVIPSDDYELVAGALLAKRLGRGAVFYLEDHDYSEGDPRREWFHRTAKRIGLHITGEATWRVRARSYRRLAQRVRASGVRAVYVNSLLAANIGQLLHDLRSELGPRVAIIANQNWTPIPALFANAGEGARGVHVTYPGQPLDRLGPTGRRFVREFGASQRGREVAPFDVNSAAATEVLLDAIARSDGTRESVTRALATTRLADSPLGPLALDRRGELTANPIMVLRAVRGSSDPVDFSLEGGVTEDVITPPARLLP
jgi:ABC-type branched-subunit amino acid transport system substrate-binding protein/outer membrane protein assembly factor BamB